MRVSPSIMCPQVYESFAFNELRAAPGANMGIYTSTICLTITEVMINYELLAQVC